MLTAAIRTGIDPDSTYYTSKPLNIDDPEYGHWEVKTFGNSYIGTVSLTRATLSSDNTVYAQLILDLGPKKVCETAKLLGITTKLDCYPAEGLGGLPAASRRSRWRARTRRSRAAASGTAPTGIEKVVFPDGKSENLGELEGKRVLTDGEAYEVTKVLKMNVQSRHRHGRQLRLPGGGQDRHDRRGQGRLVRRLHAPALRRRLGRLPGRRHRDAGRAGRHLRGAGLARLHAAGPRRLLRRLPAAHEPAEFSPFFGKYSETGIASAATTAAVGRARSAGGTTRQYDPRYYEQAPHDAAQRAAAAEQVAPARSTGTGTAMGTGSGNADGDGRVRAAPDRGRARADRARSRPRSPTAAGAWCAGRATTPPSCGRGRTRSPRSTPVVDGVHFRARRTRPRDIGWKALATALSDLAAMGADAGEAYVALVLPGGLRRAALELVDGHGGAGGRARARRSPAATCPAARCWSLTVAVTGWADSRGASWSAATARGRATWSA